MMKALALYFLVLPLIGGGLKLAGMQIPVLDYPLGGTMTQPNIQIVRPDMHLH